MALLSRKAQASVVAAILFFIVSSPATYRMVDSLIGGIVTAVLPAFSGLFKVAQEGCPTTYGLLLHASVFGVVTYMLMRSG
jgi:hypothetical protein